MIVRQSSIKRSNGSGSKGRSEPNRLVVSPPAIAGKTGISETLAKYSLTSATMGMHRLRLSSFEAVKTNHHMIALPQCGFEELLGSNAFKVAPVKKVIHHDFLILLKLTQRRCTTKPACSALLSLRIVSRI